MNYDSAHFLQYHPSLFVHVVPASGSETDQLGHLLPQTHIELHFNINLCSLFYLNAYLWHTEHFNKKLGGSWVSSLFIGKNRQHKPVHTKIISSWVRKVLSIAKANLSLVIL